MALMRFAYIQIQRISTLTKPSLNLVNSTNIHIIGLEVQIVDFMGLIWYHYNEKKISFNSHCMELCRYNRHAKK